MTKNLHREPLFGVKRLSDLFMNTSLSAFVNVEKTISRAV